MIQANELRVGNFVNVLGFDETVKEICSLGGLQVEVGVIIGNSQMRTDGIIKYNSLAFASLGLLEPIRLTEEWLIKFGFKLNSEFGLATYGNGVIGIYFYEGIGNYGIAKFKYVHELQNVYYWNVRQELKLIN